MAPSVPAPKLTIKAMPLMFNTFIPFGTVMTAPLSPTTTTLPNPPPPGTVHANQSTALKVPTVSPLTSCYGASPSGVHATPSVSLFMCFPRSLRSSPHNQREAVFDVRILERHPYTTQTFTPLNCPPNSQFIVIVAPTLPNPPPLPGLTPYFPQTSAQAGPPDLARLEAFVAGPGVGITYGMGIWHAPMVVAGEGRIDFVVTQFTSGKGEEDCQEVELEKGIEVVIDRGERAKL